MKAKIIDGDYEIWGKLVKTWATGSNSYLGDASLYPIPTSLQELKDQMARANAGTLPDNITSFEVIPLDDSTLVIELPPKKLIEENELELRNGVPYPLPQFYMDAFGPFTTVPGGALTNANFNLRLNDARVGEYTVLFCT